MRASLEAVILKFIVDGIDRVMSWFAASLDGAEYTDIRPSDLTVEQRI